jgi:hypothetical protein
MSSLGAAVLTSSGAWVGLLFSLAIFTLLAGERALGRLAQHLLVGAALGYLAVLALRHVLQPRLFTPLPMTIATSPWSAAPLVLGLLLWGAGVDAILRQFNPIASNVAGWRRWLQWAGLFPVALMLGVGVAVGLIGVIQGSLLPQLWRTIGPGISWRAAPGALLTRLLTLLLTTATLLAFTVDPEQRTLPPAALPRLFLQGWIWLGKRALWLAAGALFARLAAARLSLLIGQINFWLTSLHETGLWAWGEQLWKWLMP